MTENVIMDGIFPRCPFCEKTTKREIICSNVSANIISKKNAKPKYRTTRRTKYKCFECGGKFETFGSHEDGYKYEKTE